MFRRNVIEGFLCYFESQWKRLVLFYIVEAKRSALIWLRLELYLFFLRPHNIDETGLLSTSIAW